MIPTPGMLGALYGLSEIALSLFKRSRGAVTSADGGSLRILWLTIMASMAAGIVVAYNVPQTRYVLPDDIYLTNVAIFCFGVVLRWYAIFYLGRFFTVDVAIAADHVVIDSGPYRWIRHPSYSGALLAFLGFAAALSNILSALLIMVPITLAFMHRIRLEESVLGQALGEPYKQYCHRTKRLIPFLY